MTTKTIAIILGFWIFILLIFVGVAVGLIESRNIPKDTYVGSKEVFAVIKTTNNYTIKVQKLEDGDISCYYSELDKLVAVNCVKR